MRYARYIVAAPLLLLSLSGCGPVDEFRICASALQGVQDPMAVQAKRCREDVYYAARKAAHKAAKPYRDIER